MSHFTPANSMESPRFTGVRTFARLPNVTELTDVDLAVVGLPFDTGVTYRVGARFGPEAVRSASVMLIGRNRFGLDVVDQRAQAWPRSASSSGVVRIANMT